MPHFSIIIPTYNSENTLSKCLDSILNQSFIDYEILIMDGKSTDSTLSIAQNYNDSRIKILSEPDQGIYDAMNKGITIANGRWLYFIGSDDSFYQSSVLQEVFETINHTDLSVVYGNVSINGQIYDGRFDYKKIQSKNICHQAIFYSRKLLVSLGEYNLKYNVFSDYDLNLKWFFHNKYRSIYVDKIIANYSANGFSTKYHDTFYEDLPVKLILLGIGKLSIYDLKECALKAAIVKYDKHQYLCSLCFKLLYYILRIIDIVQRRMFV